jgi:hypothetical protein
MRQVQLVSVVVQIASGQDVMIHRSQKELDSLVEKDERFSKDNHN